MANVYAVEEEQDEQDLHMSVSSTNEGAASYTMVCTFDAVSDEEESESFDVEG